MNFKGVSRKSYERRIARRVAPEGMHVELATPNARRHWLRREPATVECFVLDMSVTGARLLVPTTLRCAAGTQVTFAVGGWTGVAHVVRLVDAADPDHVEVAVEFRALSPALRDVVDEVVAGDRRHDDWRWYVAT